ncbi:MAG: T9SS type A sorting domain-containing protein, partial [Bacteroidota bacterium]
TGVKNSDGFSVFPNPANDKINIQFYETGKYYLQICNYLGMEIYKQESDMNRLTLDMSSWMKGVYFVKVTENKKIIYRKIIIQ